MSTFTENQWHLSRHYVIGISIGLAAGLAIYFLFSTIFNQEQDTSSTVPLVQGNKTAVEQSNFSNESKASQPPTSELDQGDPQITWKNLQESDRMHIGSIVQLISTANAWITHDGLGAFKEIHKSVSDEKTRMALIGGIVSTRAEEIGFQDLFYEALEQFSDDEELRVEFLLTVTELWTRSDPISAFAATSHIKNERERVNMWKFIASIWAITDTDLLNRHLHIMPDAVSGHATWMVMAISAQQAPADAVSFLPQIAGTPHEEMLALEIAKYWAPSDSNKALEWAQEHSFTHRKTRVKVIGRVLYEIAKEDPQRALEIALSEPTDNFGKGPEAILIELLATNNIDQALELLPNVREGMGTMRAYAAVGDYFSDRYEYQRAMEFGSQIKNVTVQQHFYDIVLPQWATNKPSNLIQSIPSFESEYLQSRATMYLLEMESYRPSDLTDEQLQEVQIYLSKKDFREHLITG